MHSIKKINTSFSLTQKPIVFVQILMGIGVLVGIIALFGLFDYGLYRIAISCRSCYTLVFLALLGLFILYRLHKRITEKTIRQFFRKYLIFTINLLFSVLILAMFLLAVAFTLRNAVIGSFTLGITTAGMYYLIFKVKIFRILKIFLNYE